MRKLPKDYQEARQYYEISRVSRFIEITPKVYAQMSGGSAEPDEKTAIRLIEKKWCEGDGESDELTLEIISRGGWSGPEMLSLNMVFAQQRLQTALSGEFIAQIAEIKGISTEEAMALAQRTTEAEVPPEILELAPQIADFYAKQQAIDPGLLRETALIKRTIANWSPELTMALHQDIRIELAELADLEDTGGFEESPKALALVAEELQQETSETVSEDLETTGSLIGAA